MTSSAKSRPYRRKRPPLLPPPDEMTRLDYRHPGEGACEEMGWGSRGEAKHLTSSRRKPGPISPLLRAYQAIATPHRSMKGPCRGAMGPGFRRGDEQMSDGEFLHTLEGWGPFLRSANGSRSTRRCHCLKVRSSGAMCRGFPHGINPWADGPREDEARFAYRHF